MRDAKEVGGVEYVAESVGISSELVDAFEDGIGDAYEVVEAADAGDGARTRMVAEGGAKPEG